MTIEFTGRQTEVAPRLRALAERKLGKLSRLLRGITRAHVILTADKHRQIAEVSVHSRNLDLTATQVGTDLGASLGTVMDKLERQAKRHRGRVRERKRRGAPAAFPAPAREPAAAERPRLIRSRRFLAKPMTVDEALLEVDASRDGLLVFRDAATERINVLYRRPDGHLGLIEPEA
jgi:putative sigma-54 modulation protein